MFQDCEEFKITSRSRFSTTDSFLSSRSGCLLGYLRAHIRHTWQNRSTRSRHDHWHEREMGHWKTSDLLLTEYAQTNLQGSQKMGEENNKDYTTFAGTKESKFEESRSSCKSSDGLSHLTRFAVTPTLRLWSAWLSSLRGSSSSVDSSSMEVGRFTLRGIPITRELEDKVQCEAHAIIKNQAREHVITNRCCSIFTETRSPCAGSRDTNFIVISGARHMGQQEFTSLLARVPSCPPQWLTII